MDSAQRQAVHRAASDAEQVAWVDEHDNLLGSVSRAEMRRRRLIGRGTFILLFNSASELCVHRRTLSKALYPGYWDVAAGGMVQAGESYAESAARELQEELGIHAVRLCEQQRFFFDAPDNRLWCAVFSAVSDAPLCLQEEEISEAGFLPLAQLPHWLQGRQVCPDSLRALQLYLQPHPLD
jgi:isopentenyldiphosphate isomerase